MGSLAIRVLDRSAPLGRFNVLRTRDPDELRAQLAPLYAIARLELPRSRVRFEATSTTTNFEMSV